MVVGFVGSLYWSFTQVSWTYGEGTETTDINLENLSQYIDTKTKLIHVYGTLIFHTPINITNNGIYDIKNLVIDVAIYIVTSEYGPELNGKLIASGHNVLGNILAGEQLTNALINVTVDASYLDYLIFYDSRIKLSITISCVYFVIPFTTTQSQEIDWVKRVSLPDGSHVPPPPA